VPTILLAPHSKSEPGLDVRHVQNVPDERPPRGTRRIWCRFLLVEDPHYQVDSGTSKTQYLEPSGAGECQHGLMGEGEQLKSEVV
jgi:hypothetical protein